MKILFFLVSGFALVGCASTPSDFPPAYHQAAASIVAYPKGEKLEFDYTVLKPVSSNSCDSKTFARVLGDEAEAIYLLKLETAKIGGDAVVSYTCWTMPVDLVSNCWASKRCEGEAAKKK